MSIGVTLTIIIGDSPGPEGGERITMGKLYDYCQQIQQHIESNHLDVFKSRGELALRCGFLVSLVGPDDPDDTQKIEALRQAAREVFNLELR